jgi:capsular polysaccharide biosynthesis protein
MMRFKQRLVRERSLAPAFEAFKGKFGLPRTLGIRPVLLESERTVAEEIAEHFWETASAGEPFVHAPPRVIGEGNHRPIAGRTRSQYLACVRNAALRGRSSLIEVGGRALLDVQDDEAERLDDELVWDPVIFHHVGFQAWCIEATDAAHPLEIDEAFTMLGAHTDFFGHWMCEYLPKYGAAILSQRLPGVPVLVDAHMPKAHRDSLELLYGASCSIIEVPAFRSVRVDKLWCAPTLSYFPLHEIRNERFNWEAISAAPARLSPVVEDLRARLRARTLSPSLAGPRVYLARKATRHRRLVNSEAIEQIARSLGFVIVYPEDLSFAEQVGVTRDAQVIVAPEGSAVFLAMFASPGATLCILSHSLTDVLADYSGLLDPHGVEMLVVTGPILRHNPSTPHDSDYRIDERTFEQVVAQLVAGCSG